MIITLITGRAAELQLGPAEAAVSGREYKIDLLRKISPCGHGQLLEISPELAASALASWVATRREEEGCTRHYSLQSAVLASS